MGTVSKLRDNRLIVRGISYSVLNGRVALSPEEQKAGRPVGAVSRGTEGGKTCRRCLPGKTSSRGSRYKKLEKLKVQEAKEAQGYKKLRKLRVQEAKGSSRYKKAREAQGTRKLRKLKGTRKLRKLKKAKEAQGTRKLGKLRVQEAKEAQSTRSSGGSGDQKLKKLKRKGAREALC
ncbi:hypothetical protein LAZ67_1001816 [Cordylochernes scorpioides]|uniref:Uncharacterized protein n=1 Tax=Cordylochernes scorpioides TaxID=51811 RepID=A0ABY6JXD1_9ARAC|nr:hypothetical protein LAZ67_1001816 [Cordylochernes scorpioides]